MYRPGMINMRLRESVEQVAKRGVRIVSGGKWDVQKFAEFG